MKWTEILAFAEAVRKHETNLREERLSRERGGSYSVLARESADKLVHAWRYTGKILSNYSIEELKVIEITNADDRLQRVESMLDATDAGEQHDLLEKLAVICRRTLAATIVRCCQGGSAT